MDDEKTYGFDTRSIHSGSGKHQSQFALNPPIYQTSTFTFESIEHAQAVMSFQSEDYVYTRGNNPSLRLLEKKIADLEKGKASVAFSSGMAAVSSVVLSLVKPKEKILAHHVLYGSSYSFLTSFLKPYEIETLCMDLTDLHAVEKTLSESDYQLIYFETPSNPRLDIIDIQGIVELAKRYGCKVVVDNTFCTPYLQQPLDLGVDVVVHSATKYLNGHGDVVAGIAVSKDEAYIHRLKFDYMCELGGVMSPFNAWLIDRGLKTLSLRMERHCDHALKIAEFLKGHEKVKKVMYPGLDCHPSHYVAKKQMKHFGGLVSFELKGDLADSIAFINALKLIKIAVSLGDTETLIQLPAAMTHLGYSEDELKKIGLSPSMIRLSVGLENLEDILNDLNFAFEKLQTCDK